MTDNLWQSFANANAAIVEMEAIRSAIEAAVAEGALTSVRPSDDAWQYDAWCDEDEWIYSYALQSIRIKEVGPRGPARGTLSIALSFFRPEDNAAGDWIGGRRAKLYVGVAPTTRQWDIDGLVVDASGRSETAEASSPYRWRRTDAPDAWFFCVELDRITGRDALFREVIRPLGSLLAGGSEDEAFAGCEGTLRTDAVTSGER